MTTFRLILASIFFLVISCKKEPIANNDNPVDKGILYDTANLGTKINIGEAGSAREFFWGRNADEIFVRVYGYGLSRVTKHYQVDLLAKKSSEIDFRVERRNFDNSSMVMRGSISNVSGYYLYQFNTGIYSLLFKAEAYSDGADVSGNAVFYAIYQSGGLALPCPLDPGSCADWSPSDRCLHFIDVKSKKIVPLPYKWFYSFSKTGKRTLLVSADSISVGADFSSIYIFDNDKAMTVDSFKLVPGYSLPQQNRLYYDDETGVVKECLVDNSGEVAIINAKTRDIIQKFRPAVKVVNVQWSHEGSKLYYTGYRDANLPSTRATTIGIYDLISNKETLFGIEGYSIIPSPDNKKILYQMDNGWYIKNVQ